MLACYEPCKAWLGKKEPDALRFIYNYHITSVFVDHYSRIRLGIAGKSRSAGEGGGGGDRSRTKAAARATCRRSRDPPRSRATARTAWSPTSSISHSSRTRGSITAASRR